MVATHPVQYHVPWFRKLALQSGIRLKVYFALMPDGRQQGAGFGIPFTWDVPMLEGYEWEVLPNARRDPSLGRFLGSSTPSIRSVLSKARPDVVIITGWNALPLLQALWACMALRIPRIVRGESNSLRQRPAAIRAAHRLLLSRFDAFLAIGRSNRDFYLANGVDQSRIFDCRYFVDNQRIRAGFEALRQNRAALRAKWGIPEGRFCFLYVGKLEPKKRVFDLLHAMQVAMRAAADIHLLIVGAGELYNEASARCRASGIPVSFAGFLNQTELPGAYAAGDCLVLPSDYGETWGLVVNEAMVCGLPVIVSDRVGCGPDLVEPGVTGTIFPCGDAAALASCLVAMAADRQESRTIGLRGQDRIRSYSADEATIGTLQAVEFVLSGRT